jgi:hypothetical protein
MNSEGTSRVQCYRVKAIRVCACEKFLLLRYRAARIVFMQPPLAKISIRARDKARFFFWNCASHKFFIDAMHLQLNMNRLLVGS